MLAGWLRAGWLRAGWWLAGWLLSGLLALSTGQAAPASSAVYLLAPGDHTGLYIGSVTAGRWGAAKSVSGGTFQALSLSGSRRTVTLAPARDAGVPCEGTLYADLKTGGAARDFEVLTNAPHRLRPRKVTVLPNDSAPYRAIVKAELQRRGIQSPKVKITRLVRADLDGNGSEEVVIEAYRFTHFSENHPRSPTGSSGDYSLLLLRSVQGGQVKTDVLGEFVPPATDTHDQRSLATLYRLAGVADLNGDGRMEVAMFGSYYEGDGFSVLEWRPGQQPASRLSSGCGA